MTITRDAPLVAGPAPVLPPLLSGRRSGSAPRIEPALGSVTGLAKPVTRAAEPVAAHESVAPVTPAPVVHRPARPLPAEVPSLVDAVDEYVGEPREPAEPHRAPGFLRYTPDWLTPRTPSIPGLPELPILPDLPGPPAPEPQAAQPFFAPEPQEPAPLPELPPRMTEVPKAEPEALSRPARKRRANLGQSRRLGLGAPVSRAEGEPLIHREEPPRVVEGAVEPAPQPPPALPPAPEPPQEPPQPPAAPAHVAVEQQVAETLPSDRDSDDRPERFDDRDDEPRPPAGPPPMPPAPPTPPTDGPKRAVATVYRATPELRPVPRRRELPRATVVSAVPPDLANAVRARQQADVSTVPVYRGPKVNEAARSRGARAFAAGGAVFLPDEAGPVDSPQARGLLAHELVHAVQQRTLGGMLPSPDSVHGKALEAEAQVAERYYSGSSGAEEPAPLIHAPLPAAAPAPEPTPDLSMAAQLATALAEAPQQVTAPTQQTLHSPFDPATRAEVGKIAEDSAKHVVAEWKNPALHGKDGNAPAAAKAAAAGTAPTAGAKTAAMATVATAAAFDRDARRDALVEQRLAGLNQSRYGDQLTQLDDAQMLEIENQLDAEQTAAGGAAAPAGPTGPVYEANSKEAWAHALTGMNAEYGLGLTGYKEKVGSEKSWWGAETKDDRPLEKRLLDGFGLSSKEAETQFDTKTWWADEPAKDKAADGKSEAESDAPPAHDDWKYGQPNPDKGAFDVNRIDLDELAGRLYERVRSRLRLELLVDRERAGLLTDFR